MPTHEKGRDRDKYYQLAKDQGFRSRAAFKLIQINKRYDFLKNAKVCIDLCAAPGGWCQVAAKYMPAGSLVIGVDLLPIKAIRGVKTIVGDITTASCRKDIVAALQGWKADVVLCDGAPNIGAAYAKDAFVQNELVLAAMKTASEHLNKGGIFVTKVYRSVDYTSLLWAIQQLFTDVQSMKPNSSRSQSSEIFLICTGFTAPKTVDPKLFDVNYVFKEIQDNSLKGPDVLHKKFESSNKRQRSGYDDSLGITLFATATASEFLRSPDPVRMLTDKHAILFKSDEDLQYRDHAKTNEETKIALSDLRVLGKIDFKKLLKWRQTMITAFELEEKKEKKVVESTESTKKEPVDLDEELHQLQLEALESRKKEEKKRRKELAKERQRRDMGMNNNAFEETHDSELFHAPEAMGKKSYSAEDDDDEEEEELLARAIADDSASENSDDDDDENRGKAIFVNNDLEDELEDDYVQFLDKRRAKKTARDGTVAAERALTQERTKSNKKRLREQERELEDRMSNEREEDELLAGGQDDDESEGEAHAKKQSGNMNNSDRNELQRYLTSLDASDDSDDDEDDEKLQRRAGQWFANPLLSSLSAKSATQVPVTAKPAKKGKRTVDEQEEAVERDLAMPKTDKEKRAEKRKRDTERRTRKEEKASKALKGEDDDDNVIAVKSKGANDFEVVPVQESPAFALPERVDSRHYDSDEEDYDATDRLHTLAMGTFMLRNGRKKALIDSSYNRYAWNDPTGLPNWFLDDEMRHNKPQLPVPQALVDQIKNKYQLTGTKVIKKVAEARARKKKRAMQKLNAAKKQAAVMAENSELSERQKVKAVAKAIRNSKTEKSSKVYVATRKTQSGSSGTMSKGGKGAQLKFVDKRMKKDRRAMKILEKKRRK